MAKRLIDGIYPPEFCSRLDPAVSDVCRYLHRVFVDTDEWSVTQQQRLERLFELADRHDQLGADTVRRLRSPAPEQFWGKLNELGVANIFESKGSKLEFNPPGRKRREGEFLLFLGEPVFVEVKTMFPRVLEKAEERHLSKLCRAAGQVNYPAWVNIAIVKPPDGDFQTKRFTDFLGTMLPSMGGATGAGPGVTYRDPKSGLEAAVTFMAGLPAGPVEASPSVGPKWLRNDDYIKRSLQAASQQLPPDMACMVVLCDKLEFPARARDFHNALYGTFVVLVGEASQPAVPARRPDGFVSRGRHARVSVVAQLDELGDRQNPASELVFYHHPTPRRPLAPGQLAEISRRQFIVEIAETDGRRRLRICDPYASNGGGEG
jgi:hypothetical protein